MSRLSLIKLRGRIILWRSLMTHRLSSLWVDYQSSRHKLRFALALILSPKVEIHQLTIRNFGAWPGILSQDAAIAAGFDLQAKLRTLTRYIANTGPTQVAHSDRLAGSGRIYH